MRVSTLFAAAALALAAAIPSAAHEGHDGMAMPAGIAVTGGRIVAPPGPNAAGFAVIHNGGAEADRLIGVKGDVSAATELHEMADEGGTMKMRPVAGIDVPAGGGVELKSGGLHVMLIGLKAPLAVGATVELTFVFQKAGEIVVPMTVEAKGEAGGHDGHDMH